MGVAGSAVGDALASGMNDATLLLRQVHPQFVRLGRVTSQAFTPRATDGNRLSVYDGDQIRPEAAWLHYTTEQALESAGVVAVRVEECAAVNLPARHAPEPFPEHVVIDFSSLGRSAIGKVAKRLRDAASRRGWLYRAPDIP